MINILMELFFNTYFVFDILAVKLIGDKKTFFDKLYSIFLLPEDKKESLYKLTQAEELNEIKTYCDYAQFCRIQKFASLSGLEMGVQKPLQNLISLKGSAFRKIKEMGMNNFTETTETEVCKFLTETANRGFVFSIYALGFMQYEGIFINKNEKMGCEKFETVAKWNNIEGILFALYYDEKQRQTNINRLYTATKNGYFDEIVTIAEKKYDIQVTGVVEESEILNKAFKACLLNVDFYKPKFERLIYSKILNSKDKERILFSGQKDIPVDILDLPLKLESNYIDFNHKVFDKLPLYRENEKKDICKYLSDIDMRNHSKYRPVCVNINSEFILDIYINAFKKSFPETNIKRIDIADLNEYDFEPTKNNIFIRSCDENKQNVFLLSFKGEIDEHNLSMAKNFLQNNKRKKFFLQYIGCEIDLSSILPICFCDKQNIKTLKQFCDVITIAPVIDSEKDNLLEFICSKMQKNYQMDLITIEETAKSTLLKKDIENANKIIEDIVRLNRQNKVLKITENMLVGTAKEEKNNKHGFGFGGVENENKQ